MPVMADTRPDQDTEREQTLYMDIINVPKPITERLEMTREDSVTPLMKTTTGGMDTATEDKLTLGQAMKRYPKIVAYSLGLSTVVVGWGYDLVIVGSITGVEPFQRDYGEMYNGKLIIPALWLALWQASTPLGMAFGSVFGGWFQDRFGRRFSLMSGSAIASIGVTIIFFSFLPPSLETMRTLFFVGKLVQGFAVGILKVTAMTYMSENAPTAMRGSAMGLFPAANLVGQLTGSIVTFAVNNVPSKAGYLGAFGSQWLLALAPLLLSIFMPESPSYLLAIGKEERAAAMAHRLFAPKADPEVALQEMKASIAKEQEIVANASFIACFYKVHRRRTWIVFMSNLYPALFGLEFISKSSYFLQTIGMQSNISLLILIGGIVAGIAANALGIWILSRVGRRKVIIISLTAASVLWLASGIAGIFRGVTVAYVTAGMLIGIVIACGSGVWPGAYAVMGETSSLAMRAKSQALGGVVQQASSTVMSIVLPYVYNPDAGNAGAKTGFLYVGTCVMGVAMTFFLLPEMKDRSVGDIDEMFQLKLKVREFKGWRREDEQSESTG